MGAATTDLFKLPLDINVFNIKNNEGIFWKATYFILCYLFYYISDKEVKRMRSEETPLKMKKEFGNRIVICETDADITQNINCTIFKPVKKLQIDIRKSFVIRDGMPQYILEEQIM